MKQIVIFLIALIAIIISFTSKDKAFVLAPIVQDTIQYFPNNIGDKWTYKLNGSGNPDTIIVEIIGQGVLPNGDSAKIWNYTFQLASKTYIEKTWVSDINNYVKIYNEPIPRDKRMPFPRMVYFFPLSIGITGRLINGDWVDGGPNVLSKGSISVPAGTFTDVFQISVVGGGGGNWSFNNTIYFKEHVGLIKLNQSEWALLPELGNGLWELVSYSVH